MKIENKTNKQIKVKIFNNSNTNYLENDINNWLSKNININIVNITNNTNVGSGGTYGGMQGRLYTTYIYYTEK